MMIKFLHKLILVSCFIPLIVLAEDTDRPDSANLCRSCHQIGEESLARKHSAPPLFYAGNKFRADWLENWLQSPHRIRPAGGFYADHVLTEDGIDTVDDTSLDAHIKVDASTARELTSWLMSLTPKDDLIAASADYAPAPVSPRLGAMDFVKFKGCGGCHRDTPEYGGLSGPELYTAWQRLQPEFIVSYIKNPQAWDSESIMPDRGLSDDQIYKLANYLKTVSDED